MEKLEALLAQLRELDTKLDALLANDVLTDAQRAEHDALVAQRKGLVSSIENEKGRIARAEERTKLEAETAAAKERATEAAALAAEKAKRTVAGTGRLTEADPPGNTGRVNTSEQHDRIPASVKRYGTIRNFKGQRGGRDADERAYRFGMWALARLTRDLPNQFSFKHAVEWLDKQGSATLEKDASGAQNLVPEEFGTDLILLRENYGVARNLLKPVTMTSDTRTDPRRKGGLTANFVGEGEKGTESKKPWDNVRLTAKDIMCLTRYSNQINADAVINLGDDLAGEISYAFALLEDQCAFLGNGTSGYGGIVGIIPQFGAIVGTAKGIKVGSGTSWSALTLPDFNYAVGLLPQYADTDKACWVCHRSFYYGVMQRLELAAGGTSANEVSTAGTRPRPMYLGYPVQFSQVMPSDATAGATGKIQALLGDFSLAGSFGDRQQEQIAFADQATVNGENVFERNEIAIRGRERVDLNIHDVGDATNAGPLVALACS